MWTLQLRQAEIALQAGRLDEAFELAIQSEVRAHRRGQSLTSELVQRLKQRIAEHVAGNRYEAALRDCDRAARLGGNQADLVRLREGVLEEIAAERNEQLHRQRIGQAARQQIANGNLSLGYELCQQLPAATHQRDELSAEIRLKQQAADKAVARAEAAMKNDSLQDAVDALCEAQSIAAHRQTVCNLVQQAVSRLLKQTRDELVSGQLGQAESRLALIERLAHRDIELTLLNEIVQRSGQAAERIRHGKYVAAREQLQIVRQLLPGALWIDNTIQLTQQAQQACEAFRDSPLSLLGSKGVQPMPAATRDATGISPVTSHRMSDDPISHLLVQVDSGGRSLVIRKDTVRLGPRMGRATLDVPIQTRETMPVIEIARLEDDYFLRTADPVQVNGQPTTSRLLADGDQLVAGSRCSLRFHLPCPASRSALLRISGMRLDPPDVRQVILMDDAFLIGPDAQSHVRVRHLSRRFVMLCRDDEFIVQPVAANQSVQHESQVVSLGDPVALDGVTLLVHQFDG